MQRVSGTEDDVTGHRRYQYLICMFSVLILSDLLIILTQAPSVAETCSNGSFIADLVGSGDTVDLRGSVSHKCARQGIQKIRVVQPYYTYEVACSP